MAATCHAKNRYATKAFADMVAAQQRGRHGHHGAKAVFLRAYYCSDCCAWHTGHSKREALNGPSDARQDAIGRLSHLRSGLITDYGCTLNRDAWDGVRALSGAIRFLQQHP